MAGFDAAMERQRTEARKAWAGSGDAATEEIWFQIREQAGATEFLGYETEAAEARVAALVIDGASVDQAEAGADIVAPSAMMDGQVRAIRTALDDAGYVDKPIMAYSAKYASGFYGPFRVAADSAPQFGDRTGYQMDPPDIRQAMREIELDIEEGADIVMVKPGLCYLDIVRDIKNAVNIPVSVYQVSGEYAMIKAAAEKGWLDHDAVVLEQTYAIKRAGADLIASYFAKDVVKLIS